MQYRISYNINFFIIIFIIVIIFILLLRLLKKNELKEKYSNNKIAFLFLTYNNLKRPDIWNKFLDINSEKNTDNNNTSKYDNKYSIYLHAKEPEKVTDFILQGKHIPEHIDTCWGCFGSVEANILMMKEALKDPMNTKFILVSDSCIPIVSFDTFYNEVMKDEKCRIKFWVNFRDNSIDRYDKIINPSFEKNRFLKHDAQGLIFNRENAQYLVDTLYENKHNWINVNNVDEHYFGTVLTLKNSLFNSNNYNNRTCYNTWYKDELDNTKINNNDILDFNNKVGYSPGIFTIISNNAIDELRDKNYILIRKVDSNTKIDIDYITK
jgi:hypothetical protein